MQNGKHAYRAAWESFYTPEHIRTILRRAAACRLGRPENDIVDASVVQARERIRRRPSSRRRRTAAEISTRPSEQLPQENPFIFYPHYVRETVTKLWHYLLVYRKCKTILDEVLAAPDRWTYTDLAIAPPNAEEFEALDLYHATAGGEAALARKRRSDAMREGMRTTIGSLS